MRTCRKFCNAVAGVDVAPADVESKKDVAGTTIFDPSANVVEQILANHGWAKGALVGPKKVDPKAPKSDTQFEIGVVNDDGSVGLHPIGADGVTDKSKVVMTDQVKLKDTFKIFDMAHRLSLNNNLSLEAPTVGVDLWLAMAMQAVALASCLHRVCPEGGISLQDMPHAKIIVKSVESDFVFVPYPCVVKSTKETGPINAIVKTNPPVVFNIAQPDMDAKKDKADVDPNSKKILEFWRMRRTSERDHANMELSMVDVTCPLGKFGKGFPKTIVVEVPQAVLFKKVAPGDELVLFVPGKKKAEKTERFLPVAQEPMAKKARTVDP